MLTNTMNNKLPKILGHTTVEANCCTDENLELMGKGDESLDKIDSEKYDDFFNHINALGSGTLLRPGKLSKLSVRENFKLFKHDNDGNLVPNSSREQESKKRGNLSKHAVVIQDPTMDMSIQTKLLLSLDPRPISHIRSLDVVNKM